MAYFDPFCSILTILLFLNWILWCEIKVIWKKLSLTLGGKFPEFSFGKIRFWIGFHLLNLWAFAVSFPNGGSTFYNLWTGVGQLALFDPLFLVSSPNMCARWASGVPCCGPLTWTTLETFAATVTTHSSTPSRRSWPQKTGTCSHFGSLGFLPLFLTPGTLVSP